MKFEMRNLNYGSWLVLKLNRSHNGLEIKSFTQVLVPYRQDNPV